MTQEIYPVLLFGPARKRFPIEIMMKKKKKKKEKKEMKKDSDSYNILYVPT